MGVSPHSRFVSRPEQSPSTHALDGISGQIEVLAACRDADRNEVWIPHIVLLWAV